MNMLFSLCMFCFASFCSLLFAENGLVTFCKEENVDELFASILHLEYNLNCDLSIEVWFHPNLISKTSLELLAQFERVELKVLSSISECSMLTILEKSKFDEIFWFLPSICFIHSPELLFQDPFYIKQGSYFFKSNPTPLEKKSKETVKEIQRLQKNLKNLLYPFFDHMPSEIVSKLLFMNSSYLLHNDLEFVSPSLLLINKKKLMDALNYALELRQKENFSNVKESDLLWMGIVLEEKDFHLSYIREVGLEVFPENKGHTEVAKAQLYQAKIFSIRSFDTDSYGSYFIVDPISGVKRPLQDYENKKILEYKESYEFDFL